MYFDRNYAIKNKNNTFVWWACNHQQQTQQRPSIDESIHCFEFSLRLKFHIQNDESIQNERWYILTTIEDEKEKNCRSEEFCIRWYCPVLHFIFCCPCLLCYSSAYIHFTYTGTFWLEWQSMEFLYWAEELEEMAAIDRGREKEMQIVSHINITCSHWPRFGIFFGPCRYHLFMLNARTTCIVLCLV